jgi:hypothetical protein
MATTKQTSDTEFDEDDELDVAEKLAPGSVAAVVSGTDWTTETIVTQLKRGNIQLNPRFQRRDAWKRDRKSRFIESLIVGLPIPQIVLAESKTERGKFIVLDGKQRLLAISQFWGMGTEPDKNLFPLTALPLRPDLKGKTFVDLSTDPSRQADFDSLCNQTVRTIVIRSWRDTNFLHTVFLRLNTGSVSLSPQELRQALLPGDFSDYVDDAAVQSAGLQKLLGIDGPDSRMRDIEILARSLAFRFFASAYPGRMKRFLDDSFDEFNKKWGAYKSKVSSAVLEFEAGVEELVQVFGDDVARKPTSRQFNRAIFDALIFFHSDPALLKELRSKRTRVRAAYVELFKEGSPFLSAIESDTAGAPNTSTRFTQWAAALTKVVGHPVVPPAIPHPPAKKARAGKARRTD